MCRKENQPAFCTWNSQPFLKISTHIFFHSRQFGNALIDDYRYLGSKMLNVKMVHPWKIIKLKKWPKGI